jgi:hypothetical protein
MRFFTPFLVFGLLLLGLAAHAQDVIYLSDNTTIKGKVLKVGASEIEYQRADNATGPAYTLPRNQVLLVTYANGTSEVMNTRPAPAAPAASSGAGAAAAPSPAQRASAGSSSSSASADGPFGVGTTVLSLGLGLGNNYSLPSGYGDDISISPVFSAALERSVATAGPGTIGVGLNLGYRSIDFGGGGDDSSVGFLMVSARGAYHYPIGDKLDLYGGLGLNYTKVLTEESEDGSGPNYFNTGVTMAAFGGARYYLGSSFGLFGEVGYDLAPMRVGIALKF